MVVNYNSCLCGTFPMWYEEFCYFDIFYFSDKNNYLSYFGISLDLIKEWENQMELYFGKLC